MSCVLHRFTRARKLPICTMFKSAVRIRFVFVCALGLAGPVGRQATAGDSDGAPEWAPESAADHVLLDDSTGALVGVSVPACGIEAQTVGVVARASADRAAGLLGLACARASLAGTTLEPAGEVSTETSVALRRVNRAQWVVHDGALRVDDLDVDGVLVVLGELEVRDQLTVRGTLLVDGQVIAVGVDVRGDASRWGSTGGVLVSDGIAADRVATDAAWMWTGGVDALEGGPTSGQLRIASRADLTRSTVDAGRGVIATATDAQVNVVDTHLFAEQIAASDVLLDRAVVDGIARVASDRLRSERSWVGGGDVLLAAGELGELVETQVRGATLEVSGRTWDVDRRSALESSGRGSCAASGGAIEVRAGAVRLDGALRADSVAVEPDGAEGGTSCAPEPGTVVLVVAGSLTGAGVVSAGGAATGSIRWSVFDATGWSGSVVGDVQAVPATP